MYSSSQPRTSQRSPATRDRTDASVLVIALLCLFSAGCGGAAGNLTGATPAPATSGTVPASSHVVLVVEENHSYSTGQIITLDDAFIGTVSSDNVVRELTSAGKTWRSYAESLPSVGYTGGDSGRYVKRHNPFAYLTDVLNSASPDRQSGAFLAVQRRPLGQCAAQLLLHRPQP